MKILTLLGTRPELIRLSIIINKLDALLPENHIIVYTNQNYDHNLKDIFFDELKIRKPDYTLCENLFNNIGEFLSQSFKEFYDILLAEKPDKILVLGDTNSSLLAILPAKLKIPIYHMEAGNRSFDKNVPEETNRKIIDCVSDYNLPYTENSRQNLLSEGYHKNYVFKIGNPLCEVLEHYKYYMNKFTDNTPYVLITIHRTENVDNRDVAINIATALNLISEDKNYKFLFSMHPRTVDQFSKHGIILKNTINIARPMSYFEWIYHVKRADCVITDSGSVPEETTILHKPCVIVRNFIERQELIDNGSVILAGTKIENIVRSFYKAVTQKTDWPDPEDYIKKNVSDTVIKILMGK